MIKPKTIREAVFMAIGSGSMCWSDIDKAGVFDTTKAKKVSEDLLSDILALLPKEKESHYGDCIPRDDCERILGYNQCLKDIRKRLE